MKWIDKSSKIQIWRAKKKKEHSKLKNSLKEWEKDQAKRRVSIKIS